MRPSNTRWCYLFCPLLAHVSGIFGRFSMEEIEQVVLSCVGNKSPVPDGFIFSFINVLWPLIKEEVEILYYQYYTNGTFVKLR